MYNNSYKGFGKKKRSSEISEKEEDDSCYNLCFYHSMHSCISSGYEDCYTYK